MCDLAHDIVGHVASESWKTLPEKKRHHLNLVRWEELVAGEIRGLCDHAVTLGSFRIGDFSRLVIRFGGLMLFSSSELGLVARTVQKPSRV